MTAICLGYAHRDTGYRDPSAVVLQCSHEKELPFCDICFSINCVIFGLGTLPIAGYVSESNKTTSTVILLERGVFFHRFDKVLFRPFPPVRDEFLFFR